MKGVSLRRKPGSRKNLYQVVKKEAFPWLVKKHSDVRRSKSCGMSRTFQYVAMTKDKRNEADGCFSTACYIIMNEYEESYQ
jgi:hypothetical protein